MRALAVLMKVIRRVAQKLRRQRGAAASSRCAAVLLTCALVLGIAASPAEAQERIKLYQVALEVRPDGTLHITETITLHSEGDRFKRGFIRDFPTRYYDRLGNQVRVSFDVLAIARDGRPEPYRLEPIDNGTGVRIGQADVFLPRGDHVYRLEFESKGQIGFFKTHDELYFNAIGQGWEVPIERGEVNVRLPDSALITESAVYTGPQNSKESNAVSSYAANAFRATTTKALLPGEGLTIAVGWPKGIVMPPSAAENAQNFMRDNVAVAIGVVGLLLIVGYYLAIWNKFGRDPEGGTVIPLFSPPKNFSPAAVRFVRRMGYDRRSFAAAILSMAVKRYLDIDEKGDVFTLKRVEGANDAALTPGEKQIARWLFGGGSSIVLKNSNHVSIAAAISALGESLKREYETVYFITNQGYFWLGLIASVLVAVLMVVLTDLGDEAVGGAIGVTMMSGLAGFAIYTAFDGWRTFLAGAGSPFRNFLLAIGKTILALVAAGVAALVIAQVEHVPWLFVLVFVALGALNFVFYHLLKAPTALGAKTRAEIDGFRMYLATAEKERLGILHPPEMTPALFEKFLPFALALDVEHQWSEQFANAAAVAGNEEMRSYRPVWYSGNSWGRFGHGGFASALGGSLASATAASASPPGKSSGLGGGGFSGGGGGGGGGRGW